MLFCLACNPVPANWRICVNKGHTYFPTFWLSLCMELGLLEAHVVSHPRHMCPCMRCHAFWLLCLRQLIMCTNAWLQVKHNIFLFRSKLRINRGCRFSVSWLSGREVGRPFLVLWSTERLRARCMGALSALPPGPVDGTWTFRWRIGPNLLQRKAVFSIT